MDHNQKEESSGDRHEEEVVNHHHKCCVDCKTTKTPLWRSGPAGPKSLCNACGIRYRKKSNAMLGLNKGSAKKNKKAKSMIITNTDVESQKKSNMSKGGDCIAASGKEKKASKKLRVKLKALGKEVLLLQRPRSPVKRQRSHRKMGEVEQAAVLLMALSCGSVSA